MQVTLSAVPFDADAFEEFDNFYNVEEHDEREGIVATTGPLTKKMKMSAKFNTDMVHKINAGLYKKVSMTGKSVEATHFDEIIDGNKKTGYLICKICNLVYSETSKSACRQIFSPFSSLKLSKTFLESI